MSQNAPLSTSAGDICTAAMKECGALGLGQTATAEDMADAIARLQWMLQEWAEDRYYIYHLITLTVVTNTALLPTDPNMGTPSTPVYYFPIGPGAGASGGFETGANGPGTNPTQANSVRPQKLNACFLRQPGSSGALPIDYPLFPLEAMEDYSRIALKGMQSFPGAYFYDPAYPLGRLFLYPLPMNSIYSVGIVIREQLPSQFTSPSQTFHLPFMYFSALYLNLAIRLRPHYGLRAQPGDHLPELARGARSVLKESNTAIAELSLPQELSRPGIYNIFSDRTY